MTTNSKRVSASSNDINVQDIQSLGQRGDSGGQAPAPAPEEHQDVGTDVDLPF